MANKKIHLVVALAGIVIAGGGAWWYQNQGPGAASQAAAGAGQSGAGGTSPGGTGAPGGGSSGAPGVAGGGGFGAGGGGSAPGGGKGEGAKGPGGGGGPAPVEVAQVEAARLEDDTQAVGTLRARQGVILRPEFSGRIRALQFTDGQRVRKGQLLVQLDDTLQQAQLKQAEASAAIARTNLQRSRELASQNFVSQSAVDQNGAALEVAQAQVALAQAQVARMKILAPFDGIAGIRSVNVGDYVKDGADLVSIEDLSALWVDFRLPERFLSRLKTGQAVDLTLDAMPGKRYPARIDAIDAQLDANGRSILVRGRLVNSDGTLRGGMFARVRAVFDVRESALVIPEEALVPLGERQVVFKVIDGESGGKVAQRSPVRIGMRVPGKVEVVEGLQPGDTVVVAGQTRLMRGENVPVRVVDLNRVGGGRPGGGRPGGAGPGGPPGGSAGSVAPAPGAGVGSGGAGAPGAAPAGAWQKGDRANPGEGGDRGAWAGKGDGVPRGDGTGKGEWAGRKGERPAGAADPGGKAAPGPRP
jgi:membrane fusion protein (multidrug efflux system)